MAVNNLLASVQGSFNQSVFRFGNSSGKQCTCCSLFSITFTLVKKPGYWTTSDLDFIVTEGDRIYKNLHRNGYLMFNDLPRSISIFEKNIELGFLSDRAGILNG